MVNTQNDVADLSAREAAVEIDEDGCCTPEEAREFNAVPPAATAAIAKYFVAKAKAGRSITIREARIARDRRTARNIITRRTAEPIPSVRQQQTPQTHARASHGSSRRSAATRSNSSSSSDDGEPSPPPSGGLLHGLTPTQLADLRHWLARGRIADKKACARCDRWLSLDEFGSHPWCRTCKAIDTAARRAAREAVPA